MSVKSMLDNVIKHMEEMPSYTHIASISWHIFNKNGKNMTSSSLECCIDGESFFEVAHNIGELNNIIQSAIQTAKLCQPTYTEKRYGSCLVEALCEPNTLCTYIYVMLTEK